MTTEAQRTASRRNAAHSTGPRTAAGKRRVSRNAVTHGLDCAAVLLPEDNAGDFAHYRAAMIADHDPQGAEEQDLVERMVAAQWRLHRLWRTEGEVYATQRTRRPNADFAGPAILGDLQEERGFPYLDRKEAHLERTYHRCSVRLQVLQDLRRKGLRPEVVEEAAELPAVQLDVPASIDGGSGEIAEQSRGETAVVVEPTTVMSALPVGRASPPDSTDPMTPGVPNHPSDGVSGEIAEQSWEGETAGLREAA